MTDDIALLQRLGEILDRKLVVGVEIEGSQTPRKRLRTGVSVAHKTEAVRDFVIRSLLKIRSKTRGLVSLVPNRAQREFSATCTHRNIVLKARQMGVTTYVAARFFLQTITRPGTMTVQVAHDQESAEEIFKIVASLLGEPARDDETRRADQVTRQRPPDGVPPPRLRISSGHRSGR